eukprot:TRINITY_DN4045_c0_g1_i1.p1 TRINITY_DN4045_c0_g1~~TRINITY_DN4045_c0_g1_i1.p1  ORF type:complete len:442 (-),score=96.44 TRINITY_DN4045_c0_g1_i1:120-1445(-)
MSNKKDKKGKGKEKEKEKEKDTPTKPDESEEKDDGLMELVMGKLSNSKLTPEDASKPHVFWDTQPVPKLSEEISHEVNEPIEPDKPIDEIKKDPYNLPPGFEWVETDLRDENVLREVYTLLNENYVTDDDGMFRFDYGMSFLRWALQPPHYRLDWHIGVRRGGKQLVGFISGIPATNKIESKVVKQVEINFLCVHKLLRDKRLSPVLIKEITRRVNRVGIFQATYTAGIVLPKPIARCRYYHRTLNPKKLIAIGFSYLSPRMTLSRTIKLYALPSNPLIRGIRPLQASDVPSACKLLSNYLSQFRFAATFTEEEFAHWFIPRAGVINSYVIENKETKEITDLISFYSLPSTIINNPNYKTLKAAYSFYNVAKSVSWAALMEDALILAKQEDFDVFNCLNIMHNDSFTKELKFGEGDGYLQYYMYNWMTSEKKPEEVGVVLL